jgi:hypothetical protein
MTADQKKLKSMLVGMAIIIGFSGTMHVFLVRKKALRTHRYQPQYGNTPGQAADPLAEGTGTLRGEVIAVSFDKFFLRADGKVQPIAIGTLRMPEVGMQVVVGFEGGTPPKAVTIAVEDQP